MLSKNRNKNVILSTHNSYYVQNNEQLTTILTIDRSLSQSSSTQRKTHIKVYEKHANKNMTHSTKTNKCC